MGAVCAQREPAPSQPRGARLPGQAAALRPPGAAHRHGGHGARILLPRHPGGGHRAKLKFTTTLLWTLGSGP